MKGLCVVSELYNRIENLCAQHRVSITKMCEESGASRGSLTDLKKGRKQGLSAQTLSLIASYFDVSIEYLLGKGETSSSGEVPAITPEAHHIGVLFDRADEKDRLLTHTVLDKYDSMENVTAINTKSRNAGGFVEFDVYDEPAAAGLGNYLDAPQSHREQFPSIIVPKGADFGIRISGNSMEPMVSDGSTVFVRQTMTVESGRVGIFVLNGASYCKQLIVDRANKQVRLHSLNPDYEDIIVTPADTLVTIGQVL